VLCKYELLLLVITNEPITVKRTDDILFNYSYDITVNGVDDIILPQFYALFNRNSFLDAIFARSKYTYVKKKTTTRSQVDNTFSSPSERLGAAQLPFRRVTNDPNEM